MTAAAPFLEAVQARRSIYAIAKESPIPDDGIKEIINQAILHAPSPFNTQSTRGIILLGHEHKKLWDLAMEGVRALIHPDKLPLFEEKVEKFRGGYGTVLFYDDAAAVKATEARIGPTMWALIKDSMLQWTTEANGMAQFIAWTALELEGFGCSLQHYQVYFESKVREEWKIPAEWTLKAQLVFGKAIGGPERLKTYVPIEERVRVHSS